MRSGRHFLPIVTPKMSIGMPKGVDEIRIEIVARICMGNIGMAIPDKNLDDVHTIENGVYVVEGDINVAIEARQAENIVFFLIVVINVEDSKADILGAYIVKEEAEEGLAVNVLVDRKEGGDRIVLAI